MHLRDDSKSAMRNVGKELEKSMTESKIPTVGKKVRDTSVILTDGTKAKLSGLVGTQGLVLYFYPKDNTSGCTTEACDFRDNLKRLTGHGYAVVGVSPDSVASHEKFTAKQNLNFPLIADADGKLCKALGAWGEKKLYGRVYEGVIRTTLLLSAELKVQQVYPKVKVKGHVDAILEALSGEH